MRVRSAVVSLTDEEINSILRKLDLPVTEISVTSAGGKMTVRVKKFFRVSFTVVFGADGRHLTATVDAGVPGNLIAGEILERIAHKTAEWGVSLCSRTLVFDPQKAMNKAGISGDLHIEKTVADAGELILSIDGELPLDQFVKITCP